MTSSESAAIAMHRNSLVPAATAAPTATLSVRAGTAKVEITDEKIIPAIYWNRPAPILDKRAVSDALKAGEAIPGAVLSNAAPSLSVRFK